MTNFESSVQLNQPIEKVYNFLKDLSNHKALMPSNIEEWNATTDEAQFSIKNMVKLHLIVTNRTENSLIIAQPKGKAPIDIELKWELTSEQEQQTKAKLTIGAELNMMLKMVASGPLQKLVDHQTESLKTIW